MIKLNKNEIKLLKKLVLHWSNEEPLTENEFIQVASSLELGVDEIMDAARFYFDVEFE